MPLSRLGHETAAGRFDCCARLARAIVQVGWQSEASEASRIGRPGPRSVVVERNTKLNRECRAVIEFDHESPRRSPTTPRRRNRFLHSTSPDCATTTALTCWRGLRSCSWTSALCRRYPGVKRWGRIYIIYNLRRSRKHGRHGQPGAFRL